MKKHEKDATKAYTKELAEWLGTMPVKVCPWTMGASILGVVAYVDILEDLPDEPMRLWRIQLREEGGALVMETLDMGSGDESFWKQVGRQGVGGPVRVVETVRFSEEG